jgi:hypothetical protein
LYVTRGGASLLLGLRSAGFIPVELWHNRVVRIAEAYQPCTSIAAVLAEGIRSESEHGNSLMSGGERSDSPLARFLHSRG